MRHGSGSGAGGTVAGILLVIGAAAIAALLGLVPSALSLKGTIVLALLGIGALAAVLFRRGSRTAPFATPGMQTTLGEASEGGGSAAASTSEPVLRLPRLLFYLGALTVTEASVRPFLGLTVSELFFIAAFWATVAAVLAGRPTTRIPKALVLGVALFAVGGLISSPNAASPARSVVEVTQGVYVMLLWIWTGATVLRSRGQIVTALSMWTVSAAVNGFAALTQVLGSAALGGPLEGSRATGFCPHANDLGGACAVALVPALMLATGRLPGQRATVMRRMSRWVILGLIATGLVLSGSVTSMLAAFVTIVIWSIAPAVRAPGRLAVVTGLAFAILAVMLVGGSVTSPTQRIEQVTSSSGTQAGTGTADVRIKTVQRALPRIEQDPIVGAGFDGAGGAVNVIDKGQSTKYQIHSAPVAVWYEAGILGLVGLLVVAWTLAKTSWRSLTAGDDENDMLIGLAMFASGIAFVIIALTSPFIFQQYGWFTAVMLVAWRCRRDLAEKVFVTTGKVQRAVPATAIVPRPAGY